MKWNGHKRRRWMWLDWIFKSPLIGYIFYASSSSSKCHVSWAITLVCCSTRWRKLKSQHFEGSWKGSKIATVVNCSTWLSSWVNIPYMEQLGTGSGLLPLRPEHPQSQSMWLLWLTFLYQYLPATIWTLSNQDLSRQEWKKHVIHWLISSNEGMPLHGLLNEWHLSKPLNTKDDVLSYDETCSKKSHSSQTQRCTPEH